MQIMKNIKLLIFLTVFILLSKFSSSQISKAYIKIEGAHCLVCSNVSRESLSKLPFVKGIEYDVINKEFVVNIIEGVPVDIYTIQTCIHNAGQSVAKLILKYDDNSVKSSNEITLNNKSLSIVNPSLEGSEIQIIGKNFVNKVDLKKYKKDYSKAYKALHSKKLTDEDFAIVVTN